MSSTKNDVMYIYKLPYHERKELCRILDQNDKWEELGGCFMKFDVMTLQNIRREVHLANGACQGSPTEKLLTLWGHSNHTVLELFILLSQMHHYQSMMTLKPFVDPKYHSLIYEGDIDHNISNLIQKLPARYTNESCHKDLKIAEENFNNNANKVFRSRTNSNNSNAVSNARAVTKEDNKTACEDSLKPVENVQTRKKSFESEILSDGGSSKLLLCTQISYEELSKATNNWDPSTILGKGGFGTVFKGTWKCTSVAIKRIEQREGSPEENNIQIKQSITELHYLNAYRHDNILPLYGYSLSGLQPCLVYQYMPGGCLEQRLRVRDLQKQLKWAKRLYIATGIARGLQFLHTIGEKPLIHGDIKSANILLDQNDEPKIGDFGLAREGPQSDYTHINVSRIHGTRPYLPDEFLRAKQVSVKVDTYSFGVVLFEIATGLPAYSNSRQNQFLKDHVVNYEGDIKNLIDYRAGKDNEKYFYSFISIGKLCVSKKPKDRPEMIPVLKKLEESR